MSSGIIRNPDYTMESVVAVARRLRVEHGFRGYIHLKTIPEASPALIQEAGRWADRLSINVELPTQGDLDQLAPEKNLARIETSMGAIKGRIEESRSERRKSAKAPVFAPAGQSTQMIVGATPASDAAILTQASHLYGKHRLRRVYYSAFSPIPDASSRLPLLSPPMVREHRLYQADWLLRFYGFAASELANDAAPNLELGVDPKTAWALRNPAHFPVNLNRAPRERMLRVPGLGVRNVDRILAIRRWQPLRVTDLVRLRVSLKKTLPFVEVTDHRPRVVGQSTPVLSDFLTVPAFKPQQLDLFAPPSSVATGQL